MRKRVICWRVIFDDNISWNNYVFEAPSFSDVCEWTANMLEKCNSGTYRFIPVFEED